MSLYPIFQNFRIPEKCKVFFKLQIKISYSEILRIRLQGYFLDRWLIYLWVSQICQCNAGALWRKSSLYNTAMCAYWHGNCPWPPLGVRSGCCSVVPACCWALYRLKEEYDTQVWPVYLTFGSARLKGLQLKRSGWHFGKEASLRG